jgi:acetylornithine deacetylase/succinyl-diaminopimelate desuccinylase family protein
VAPDPLEARIARWVDDHAVAQVEFLAQLVRLPSDNPPGDCRPHAERTAALLAGLGFTVEPHAVPDDLVRSHGMRSITNLIVRRRFCPGPTIALNAHGDVVPPGDGWTTDPYGAEVRDGWMYGRGVAVSKSDIATYGFALKALEASGAPLKGSVELHITYDEEAGGLCGPEWLLAQGLSKPDFAICPGFAYDVVIAHNGCLHLEVAVQGKSAHAAMPETGVDALEATTRLLAALYELRKGYSSIRSKVPGIASPTLVVGLIKGGINTNVVPDAVTLRLDRRIIPEEDPEQVERELIQQIAAAVTGASCAVRRVLLVRPFTPKPGQDKLAALIRRRAQTVLGEDIPANGVPIYADARLYSSRGIPTVMYGAGPRSILDANGHRADERIPLDSLLSATKVVALSIADLLGS